MDELIELNNHVSALVSQDGSSVEFMPKEGRGPEPLISGEELSRNPDYAEAADSLRTIGLRNFEAPGLARFFLHVAAAQSHVKRGEREAVVEELSKAEASLEAKDLDVGAFFFVEMNYLLASTQFFLLGQMERRMQEIEWDADRCVNSPRGDYCEAAVQGMLNFFGDMEILKGFLPNESSLPLENRYHSVAERLRDRLEGPHRMPRDLRDKKSRSVDL